MAMLEHMSRGENIFFVVHFFKFFERFFTYSSIELGSLFLQLELLHCFSSNFFEQLFIFSGFKPMLSVSSEPLDNNNNNNILPNSMDDQDVSNDDMDGKEKVISCYLTSLMQFHCD